MFSKSRKLSKSSPEGVRAYQTVRVPGMAGEVCRWLPAVAVIVQVSGELARLVIESAEFFDAEGRHALNTPDRFAVEPTKHIDLKDRHGGKRNFDKDRATPCRDYERNANACFRERGHPLQL